MAATSFFYNLGHLSILSSSPLFSALCPISENSGRRARRDTSGLPHAVPVWAPAYRKDLHGFKLARGRA